MRRWVGRKKFRRAIPGLFFVFVLWLGLEDCCEAASSSWPPQVPGLTALASPAFLHFKNAGDVSAWVSLARKMGIV